MTRSPSIPEDARRLYIVSNTPDFFVRRVATLESIRAYARSVPATTLIFDLIGAADGGSNVEFDDPSPLVWMIVLVMKGEDAILHSINLKAGVNIRWFREVKKIVLQNARPTSFAVWGENRQEPHRTLSGTSTRNDVRQLHIGADE